MAGRGAAGTVHRLEVGTIDTLAGRGMVVYARVETHVVRPAGSYRA